MENIKLLKNNIKEKRTKSIIILLVSIIVFSAYIVRLNVLIGGNYNYQFGSKEFIRLFNAILGILAVLSCWMAYSSNKNEDLFLISLMYVIFVCDIIISNVMNSKNNNISSYMAMATSAIRILIAIIAISPGKFLKNKIIENKVKSVVFIILTTFIFTCLEYHFGTNKHIISKEFFIIYHILLFIIYFFIASIFFIKSMIKKEYIYSVIGFSILMFSIKAIYSIANQIYQNSEIDLTSVSITYIGFLIFILCLFVELTKNINNNKTLDKERSLFYNIIEENLYSNIVICDDNYKILYSNKKSKETENKFNILYSFKNNIMDEFNIKNLYFNESDYNKSEKHIQKYGSYHNDIHIAQLNKKIDISIQRFEKYDEKYRVVRFHDITKRYELEKSLLELENIKKEENMKNEFFANISHELKTPLNIIYSTMQLLTLNSEKESFKDLYLKYKNSLDINCKRMLRLIDNIVDITKLEVGFKVPQFNNYDIVRLIEGITMSIINYAKIKDIEVIFDTDIEELYIKCDPDMIERIMLNLLSNAIKFTKNGGTIFVDIKSNDKLVNISVKDDGVGIPIDIQSKIFNRFVQNDKSLMRENEGSGIGLSIVKSIVELMGGQIYLESDGENGCEFIVSLPNEKLDIHNETLIYNKYDIDIQRIQLEFSDIYELYDI